MSTIIIPPVTPRIAAHPNPDECWLRCDQCQRFFQRKSARSHRDRAGCPFRDCTDFGCDIMVSMWDDAREPDDPRWPTCEAELEHGMRSPDMEPFYAEQRANRIDQLVSDFTESPEARAAIGDERPRYTARFLEMMADLCWDLTDVEEDVSFSDDIAWMLVDQLPVWAQVADPAEVPRMAAEVRTLFDFARRTDSINWANEWFELLASEQLEHVLLETMLNDRRLRPAAPKRVERRATSARHANRKATGERPARRKATGERRAKRKAGTKARKRTKR